MGIRYSLFDANYEEGKIQLVYEKEFSTGSKDYHGETVYEKDANPQLKKVPFYAEMVNIKKSNNKNIELRKSFILNDYSEFEEITTNKVEEYNRKLKNKLESDNYYITRKLSNKIGSEYDYDLICESNIELTVELDCGEEWTVTFYSDV